MKALPPSHRGYGIKTRTTDTEFQLVLDPRGELAIAQGLYWTPGSLQVGLPAMMLPPNANAFELQKAAAAQRLDEITGDKSTSLGELVRVLDDIEAWSLTLEATSIWLRLRARPPDAHLDRLVKALAKIADAFNGGRTTEILRLMNGFRTHEAPEHRLYELKQLCARHAKADETTRALKMACGDRDLGIRLYAAKMLGEDGLTTLADIAREPRLDLSVRQNALAAFCAAANDERRLNLLAALATSDDRGIAAAAMDALDYDAADVVLPLMLSIVHGRDEILGAVAVRKLLRFSADPSRFEPKLLALLEHPIADSLYYSIVDLLGEVGTAAALPVLQRALRGTFFNARAKASLRTAIDALKKRLRLADPGSISVADASGGEISRPGSRNDG